MRAPLVERARRGDDVAFGELVDADGDRCFAIAYRILRDHEAAQDAVQQAFLLAWRDLPELAGRRALRRLAASPARERVLREIPPPATVDEPDQDAAGSTDRPAPTRRVSVDDRDLLERAFTRGSRRNTARCSFSITTPGSRSPRSPRSSVCPLARSSHDSTTRPARCERRSRSIRHPRHSGDLVGMSAPRDPDVILAAWLDDGPADLPGLDAPRNLDRRPDDAPGARWGLWARSRGGPRCPSSDLPSPVPPRSSR